MSLETMASYLNMAQRYLPAATTAASSFTTIKNLAQTLPPSPLTVFESHLDDPQPDMDFLLSATPERLLGRLPPNQTAKEWTAVQELCHMWQKLPDNDPFRREVTWIWLEFDTSADKKNSQKPGIYFLEGFETFNRETKTFELQSVLEKLLGTDPSAAMLQQFDHIFRMLPSSGRLFALGNMSGRDIMNIRVSLTGLPYTELVSYLAHIAWPGDLAAVASLVATYAPYLDYKFAALDLDVGEEIGPKIGIELYMPARHATSAWRHLFDKLVEQGLCLGERRDQLMQWPGFSNAYTDADIWPDHLILPEEQGHYLFVRRINHVKLTIEPQKPLRAKAYMVLERLHTKQRPLKISFN